MARLCRDLNSPLENFFIILAAILLIALIAFGANYTARYVIWKVTKSESAAVEEKDAEKKDNVVNDGDDGSNSGDIQVSEPTISKPNNLSSYTITRVRDGDTVEVDNDKSGVRLIGVDTPETVNPDKEIECFGPEASSAMKELLGQTIELELDPSQGERDSYGRLLAYVWLGQVNVNYILIRDGYGYEYTYDLPYKYQEEFKWAENYAREQRAGLWSACVNII